MATEIAQRELRRLPIWDRSRTGRHPGAFASLESVFAELTGVLDRDDLWDEEIGELRAQPGGVVDPFEDFGGSRRRPNEQ